MRCELTLWNKAGLHRSFEEGKIDTRTDDDEWSAACGEAERYDADFRDAGIDTEGGRGETPDSDSASDNDDEDDDEDEEEGEVETGEVWKLGIEMGIERSI